MRRRWLVPGEPTTSGLLGGPISPRQAFRDLPGSDALRELWHLLRDPRRYFHERFERYGPVFKTRLVYRVVFVVGEEANRTIMITRRHEFGYGAGYAQTAVRRVFENSIMLQDGDEHRRTRDLLGPAVGRLAVRESTERVRAIWADASARLGDGAVVDVYELAERTTFAVMANVLTGLALGPTTDAFRPEFERLIEGVLAAVPVRTPFGKLDRALRSRDRLRRMLTPHVEQARARPPDGLVGQLAHHRDEHGRLVPVDEIIDHLLLLAWAGYDTTASATSWILHVLAERPDWQARLRDELDAIDDPTDLERGKVAPNLEHFLLEIERMYPSVLFFPRIALRDLEIDGHWIPEGTPTFYSPYMSHHDPRTFDDPDAFDPDRWDASRGAKRARPATLFGFGGGPRVCLGKSFAKQQLRLMTHAILTRHRLRPDPTCRPHIMGVPVHHPVGSRVRFIPRKRGNDDAHTDL